MVNWRARPERIYCWRAAVELRLARFVASLVCTADIAGGTCSRAASIKSPPE